MLFPQQNTHRVVLDLSGFWRFRADSEDAGEEDRWMDRPLPVDAGTMRIAVPGAWNEQLAERGLKNYVGAAWYETEVTLPARLTEEQRVRLFVGAADHRAAVWCNGVAVGRHEGGYLPFELDLTAVWQPGRLNRLTLCVDSRLTLDTLPQDLDPTAYPYNQPDYDRRHYFPPARFDFFTYGGLTRSVYLHLTPATRLERLVVDADLSGQVTMAATVMGDAKRAEVVVFNRDGLAVGSAAAPVDEGTASLGMTLADVQPWCPADPHLYRAAVALYDRDGDCVDVYEERFGIREVQVDGGQLLLNGEPLYLAGFGKHEDVPIIGRGQFKAVYVRDFELMRWAGANSFRTSHYPYDEEMLRLADELGFLVIDEVPSVSLGFYSDDFDDLAPLLDTHKRFMTDLIARDRNHPSVIAWSVVNEANLWGEPYYQNAASRRYFSEVYAHTKSLDATRPVIAVTFPGHGADDDALIDCDLIGINRYYGWYSEPADLAHAAERLAAELDLLYETHGKPIMVTEFGADTVAGVHSTTMQLFSEEYQEAFIQTYNRVIESRPFCIGAHVWNFADFYTAQNHRRVVHNLKGVFTRNRTPKRVAFTLRQHWQSLTRIAPAHRPMQGPDGLLIPDLTKVTAWAPRGMFASPTWERKRVWNDAK